MAEDKKFRAYIENTSEMSPEARSQIYSISNDKEIRIADQNIFNEKQSGPDLTS